MVGARYGVLAIAVALATWFALSTYARARQADQLEAALKAERNIAASKEAFNAKVDGIRQDFETRLSLFQARLNQIGDQRRMRRIRRTICFILQCLVTSYPR